jgi:tetratricopeptide (TPR) repeat protein
VSLLLEAFERLPQPRLQDDAELWQAGVQEAVHDFQQLAKERYSEGTLQRMATSCEVASARQAAVFALGLLGTMDSNAVLASVLRDDADELVRRFAADALWEIWYRGESADQAHELRQAMALPDFAQQLAALDDVIRENPTFAEAYNQRAILHFRRGQYGAAVEDCERVLQLNPFHFGAASGLGQCRLRLNRPHSALRAFAHALELHPHLTHLQQTVQTLRAALEE